MSILAFHLSLFCVHFVFLFPDLHLAPRLSPDAHRSYMIALTLLAFRLILRPFCSHASLLPSHSPLPPSRQSLYLQWMISCFSPPLSFFSPSFSPVVVFAVDDDEGCGLLSEEAVLARMEKRHGEPHSVAKDADCAIVVAYRFVPS